MSETPSILWEQPESFLARWQGQDPERIAAELKSLLNAQVDRPDTDHGAWAEVAEGLGLPALALREAQLAVRDQPQHPEALKRLGRLLIERGQSGRAAVHLETALKLTPEDPELLESLSELYADQGQDASLASLRSEAGMRGIQLPVATEREGPASAEAAEHLPHVSSAIRFLHAFGGREDVHARQWASRDGRSGYTPVQQPLTPKLIQGHLAGNETLGVYCLRLDGTVNFLALDLDISKSALEEALINPQRAAQIRLALQETVAMLYQGLQEFGLHALIENSGYKGRHLWLLFNRPVQAEIAHLFGNLFHRRIQSQIPAGLHLEVFPKQANLESRKGLGNLIKLPLGIHQKSGRRSHFMSPAGEAVKGWDRHLAEFPRTDPDTLYSAIETLKLESLPDLTIANPETRNADTLPAPPAVQRVWTEADFKADPGIAHLLLHCPVLLRLKQQAERQRQLSNDEQLVLIHTLGQLKNGVLAVNYLFSRCANIAPERYLKSRLQGSPTSCVKIRTRLPHITSKVACNCAFAQAPDHYPTPELHLRTLSATEPVAPPDDLITLARRYAALERRLDELRQEQQGLGLELARQLKAQADPVLVLPEGRYVLRQANETEELVWEPAEAFGTSSAESVSPSPVSADGP